MTLATRRTDVYRPGQDVTTTTAEDFTYGLERVLDGIQVRLDAINR